MNIKHSKGVSIELDGNEVATAIDAWLAAQGVRVSGPRTITVNGELCERGQIYVDPSGSVITPEGDMVTLRDRELANKIIEVVCDGETRAYRIAEMIVAHTSEQRRENIWLKKRVGALREMLAACFVHLGQEIERKQLNDSAHDGTQTLSRRVAEVLDASLANIGHEPRAK